MYSKKLARGAFIGGISRKTRRKFERALLLEGAGNQSRWLLAMINRFIAGAEQKHGDLFAALTAEERWLVEVVHSGAAEPQQIAEETGINIRRATKLVNDLVELGVLVETKQGGKTESARGARRSLYFVSEKISAESLVLSG